MARSFQKPHILLFCQNCLTIILKWRIRITWRKVVKELIITIPGTPIPLKRPRMGRKRVYDTQKDLKGDISLLIRQQMPFGVFCARERCPVRLYFSFHMPIPKSRPKSSGPHICKPDLDNCIKFYCDVCNGLLFYDDAQVYTIHATKQYSPDPKTVIKILWENHSE